MDFRIFGLIEAPSYRVSIKLNSSIPKIVETIPGWQHSIKNIGKSELIVLIWSNEIFDANNPDTFQL